MSSWRRPPSASSRRRGAEADAGGLRFALRAAAAGRERRCATGGRSWRSSSSFATPRLHGHAARRHDGHRSRPAGAEHRPRRDPARAAQSGIRLGASPAAHREVPRRALSRRLSRLRDQDRRPDGVSAPGGRRASHVGAPRRSWPAACPGSMRCWAAASRRAPARCSSGAAGTGKSTLAAQFVAGGGRPRPEAALFMFDESPQTLLSRCDGLDIDLGRHVAAGTDLAAADRPRRAHAGRVRARASARRRGARRQGGRHRQPQRLSQRHARGAVPHHSAARAADVPGATRRGDHSDCRASGL